MPDIEVRSRVTGTPDDLPAVLVRLATERTSARELIGRAVEEQIRLAGAASDRIRRSLDRQFLSDDDLRAQAATGRIRMPQPPPAAPDVLREIERACHAFDRGTFVMIVGGRQVSGLDDEITVRVGDPVVFLRLVALAGG